MHPHERARRRSQRPSGSRGAILEPSRLAKPAMPITDHEPGLPTPQVADCIAPRSMRRRQADRSPVVAAAGMLLALMLGACASPSPKVAPETRPVSAVARVDLERYAGRWYELAAYPMFFQRQCVGDTTADYAIRPDGRIDVMNRCRTATGQARAQGVAWAQEGSGNARLKVSFFWPFRADYWVIGLDEDYRWAVIGEPGRRYLWILSRTPQLPAAELERARRAAAAQGYDLAPLRTTTHGG